MWEAISVPAEVGEALAQLPGPVLLVDDQVNTGWTMTVAAMRMRQAGASAVLPFVLASGSA